MDGLPVGLARFYGLILGDANHALGRFLFTVALGYLVMQNPFRRGLWSDSSWFYLLLSTVIGTLVAIFL